VSATLKKDRKARSPLKLWQAPIAHIFYFLVVAELASVSVPILSLQVYFSYHHKTETYHHINYIGHISQPTIRFRCITIRWPCFMRTLDSTNKCQFSPDIMQPGEDCFSASISRSDYCYMGKKLFLIVAWSSATMWKIGLILLRQPQQPWLLPKCLSSLSINEHWVVTGKKLNLFRQLCVTIFCPSCGCPMFTQDA